VVVVVENRRRDRGGGLGFVLEVMMSLGEMGIGKGSADRYIATTTATATTTNYYYYYYYYY